MDSYDETIRVYDNVADDYLEKFSPLTIYHHTYESFLSRLSGDASVLDLGCGPGIISKYLQDRKPDLRIHCVDGSPKMISLARGNLNARFTIADCRSIELSENYDAIACGFVMPYLSPDQCAQLIVKCSQVLNSGGWLYVSVEEGPHSASGYRYSSDGSQKLFMNLYLEADFAGWFEEAGLQIVETFRIPYGEAPNISTHLILIAGKLPR